MANDRTATLRLHHGEPSQRHMYIGVTSNLIKRVHEHKGDLVEGFTRSYQVHALVWFEQHVTMESAITREKALKEWKRAWKIDLIEAANPYWRDLFAELC